MASKQTSIGRLDAAFERRHEERRLTSEIDVLSTHRAFARNERTIFRELERRRKLRRHQDARRAIASLT